MRDDKLSAPKLMLHAAILDNGVGFIITVPLLTLRDAGSDPGGTCSHRTRRRLLNSQRLQCGKTIRRLNGPLAGYCRIAACDLNATVTNASLAAVREGMSTNGA